MKRKTIRGLTAALLAVLMLLFTVSCGQAGKSAYEIAVAHGFAGSEEEWLLSLVGASGADGKDGRDGLDATEGLVRSVQSALLSSVCVVARHTVYSDSGVAVKTSTGTGAGVIIRLDTATGTACFLTNYHVLYTRDENQPIAETLEVYLYGLEDEAHCVKCEYLGGSLSYDLAVLRVADCDVLKNAVAKAATWRSSAALAVGETVFTIGNPADEGLATSVGMLTQESETVYTTLADGTGMTEKRLLRLDAAVNHGNSGGGFFDASGNLIGIVVAKNTDESVDGVGYAIPSDVARAWSDNLIDRAALVDTKVAQKCLLGVTVTTDSAYTEIDENGILRQRENVLVKAVGIGTPAYNKVEMDDVIVAVEKNGVTTRIDHVYRLVEYMLTVRPGDSVTVTVRRSGEEKSFVCSFAEKDLADVQ